VLDIDGVVLLGDTGVPGAGDALGWMRHRGLRVVFATNAATRTRADIAARITRLTGYDAAPTDVVSSAIAAASMLTRGDHPVFVVGEPGLVETLESLDIRVTADAQAARTVIVALDRSFSYDTLAAASTAIRNGARFIATNEDLTFPTPQGQVPGAGSIVAAVAAAAGVTPVFAGKPNAPMVEAVRRVLGPGPTWMIGDRPETDLAFARAAGWSSILTLSGVTTDPDAVPAEWTPDVVVASIAELVAPQ
jgi:4-nitrophenyl phosphatase